MTKLFIVSCGSVDLTQSESQNISWQNNENKADKDLESNTKEQALSVYELLSLEYEEQNPSLVETPSITNHCHTSNRSTNKTLKDARNNSCRNQSKVRVAPNRQANNANRNQDDPETSLELERQHHEGTFRRRKERFQSIISNQPIDLSLIDGLLYTPRIIILAFLSTVPLSLTPAHDLLQNPEYWYEHIFHGILSTTSGWILQCFRASYFLNITNIRKIRNVFFMCLIGDGSMITFIIGSYYVWTKLWNYTYPVPFLGLIATYSFRVLYCISQWFCFPKAWRQNKKFQNQMKFFVFYILFTILTDLLYNITVGIVRKVSIEKQPLASLALPIARETFSWLSSKLVQKCANGDVGANKIILKYIVSTVYTISLCYLVTVVEDATSWVLVIVDFSINTFICLRVVWLNKQEKRNRRRSPLKIESQISLLQDLALYELVEFQAPLTFILVLTVAYFGPNAELFGNVGNSYWKYQRIEDFPKTLINMLFLFAVDFGSTILSSLMLWSSCRINLWKAFVVLQNEFGTAFSVLLGYIVLVVCN